MTLKPYIHQQKSSCLATILPIDLRRAPHENVVYHIYQLCVMLLQRRFFHIFPLYKSMVDNDMPGAWSVWTPGVPLAALIKESIIHWSTQHMKALGHIILEKKIFFMFFS